MPIYTARFARIGKALERGVNESVQAIAIAVDTAVVLSTRVDTGRARSNWLVSLGSASRQSIDPYVPGTGGKTASANASAAQQHAASVIGTRRLGQSIHITNSLPYIEKLNVWDGMVAKGVQAGQVAGRTVVPKIIERALRSR